MSKGVLETYQEVQPYLLRSDAGFPNNPRLPLLIYPGALDVPRRDPDNIGRMLSGHHWENGWRNGIYSCHHYHSTRMKCWWSTPGRPLCNWAEIGASGR